MPVIGITCDTVAGHSPSQWKYESQQQYSYCVVQAGGVPVLLPYETGRIPQYLQLCKGFILSGGDDPDTTVFGQPTHLKSKLVHHRRQEFESALIKALGRTQHPVLGVCFGMQMMALHAGGRLHSHLPEAKGIGETKAADHLGQSHNITLSVDPHPILPSGGSVFSKHHQAVADPGDMRVVAEAGGVIEAVDYPGPRFYLGVQWHPEWTDNPTLGQDLITRFVKACQS